MKCRRALLCSIVVVLFSASLWNVFYRDVGWSPTAAKTPSRDAILSAQVSPNYLYRRAYVFALGVHTPIISQYQHRYADAAARKQMYIEVRLHFAKLFAIPPHTSPNSQELQNAVSSLKVRDRPDQGFFEVGSIGLSRYCGEELAETHPPTL